METYLIYIDESYDETHFVYSALFISVAQWESCFKKVLEWRHKLQDEHGISYKAELHATEFVAGRGIKSTNHHKDYRANLFYQAFQFFETLDELTILNGITENKNNKDKLFDWVVNRINRTLKARNAYGVLVCDQGDEGTLVPLIRKMKKINLVPGRQEYGGGFGDFPLKNIIEDPLFKNSKSSYFIQMADFIAFSLLRNEHPVSSTHAKVQSAFDQLDNRLIKVAFRDDPKGKGIVRV